MLRLGNISATNRKSGLHFPNARKAHGEESAHRGYHGVCQNHLSPRELENRYKPGMACTVLPNFPFPFPPSLRYPLAST
jgi:hypothetical protein